MEALSAWCQRSASMTFLRALLKGLMRRAVSMWFKCWWLINVEELL